MYSHVYLQEVGQDSVNLVDDGSDPLTELLVELAVSMVEIAVCLEDLLQQ